MATHKNLKLTIAWYILAFLIICAVVWQTQVTLKRDVFTRIQALLPPLKTRHAERDSGRDTTPGSSGDSAVDYRIRRANGLSDREIGWIISDFRTAGLDLGVRVATPEQYLSQRKIQDRWYHDAHVEAWSLTPAQSSDVAIKLKELNDRAKADFIEALASGPRPIQQDGKWYSITSADPIHRLIDSNRRLQDPAVDFLPWNLCEMTAGKDDPFEGSDVATDPDGGVVIPSNRRPPSDPAILTVDRYLPQPGPRTKPEPLHVSSPEGDILAPLREMHPAQLKLLLLVDPDRIRKILPSLAAATTLSASPKTH